MRRPVPFTLVKLAAELRSLNAVYDGCGSVVLDYSGELRPADDSEGHLPYTEPQEVPGDGSPFDAVACARRLAVDWRTLKKESVRGPRFG